MHVRESKSILPLTEGYNDPQLLNFIFSGTVTGLTSKQQCAVMSVLYCFVFFFLLLVLLCTKTQVLIFFFFSTEENKIVLLSFSACIKKAAQRMLFLNLITCYGFEAQPDQLTECEIFICLFA